LEKVNFFIQRTINWDDRTRSIRLIDQTKLPREFRLINCSTVRSLVHAIKTMQIRGAPAIGVAGAMGVALSISEGLGRKLNLQQLNKKIRRDSGALIAARPTAVNLAWGVNAALDFLSSLPDKLDSAARARKLIGFVKDLADKDVDVNKKLSRIGQELIKNNASILTHCK
jgi:methylthioribose-1-phosphate isomerase